MIRAEFHRPEADGFWPVSTSEHYVTDELLLEQVFEAFNIGTSIDPMIRRSAEVYRLYQPGARSMSVGDTVTIVRSLMAGEPDLRLTYRCEPVGWVRTGVA